MKHFLLTLLGLTTLSFVSLSAQSLRPYPMVEELPENLQYTVQVRQPGGEWQDVQEWDVPVNRGRNHISAVAFDFSGKVEVKVVNNDGPIESVIIRPLRTGLKPEKVEGDTLWLTLDQPQKLAIEINDMPNANLNLFAQPLLEAPPSDTPNLIYLAPGVHNAKTDPRVVLKKNGEQILTVKSDTTVFFAPGAVLQGKIHIAQAKNVRIAGHGIIDQRMYLKDGFTQGILIDKSSNVTIENLLILNHNHYGIMGGQSKGLTIRDFQDFSSNVWGDGIDLMSCQDVVIDNIYMRNGDDCLAFYGTRRWSNGMGGSWGFAGTTRNIQVTRAILWSDGARPTFIGAHGDYNKDGDIIEDITFHQIDVLDHKCGMTFFMGAISINAGDKNVVRRVRYEDVVVERISMGMLMNFRVIDDNDFGGTIGKSVQDVTVKDYTFYGYPEALTKGIINGFDASRMVSGVTIQNLKMINEDYPAGKVLTDWAEANIEVGPFTKSIQLVR